MQTSSNTTCDVIDIDVQANLEMYLIEPILKPQQVSHRHQSGKWQRRGGVGGQWKMDGVKWTRSGQGLKVSWSGVGLAGWVCGDSLVWGLDEWVGRVGVRWVGLESGV